jgi:hypothetical protein
MINSVAALRSLVVYAICVPLALVLGYLLANPIDLASFTFMGVLVLVLIAPLILKWHQPMLLFSWNMSAVVFFLPGRPNLWLVLAAVGLGIAVLRRAMDKKMRFVNVPSLTWPLLFLVVVVVVTAKFTGGIGFQIFGGGAYGGKRYLILLGTIAAYFAVTAYRIDPERAKRYTALFFLGGATFAIGSLITVISPSFYFIFMVFPVERMPGVILGREETYVRVIGLAFASTALVSFLLSRYGISGIFAQGKRWRLLAFAFSVIIGLFGGFRSMLFAILLTFAIQFYLEGLHRTKLLAVLGLTAVLAGAFLVPFVPKLPPTFQRALAFLPVNVDPMVRQDVQGSTEWRIQMWRRLMPEVPRHLFLGKGYSIDAAEFHAAQQEARSGHQEDFYTAMIAGDYHSGPLSVILPFGIWGAIAWLWLLWAGFRVLYYNYRYGDPALWTINAFLLAAFIAQTFVFFFIFGSLYSDLLKFLGLLGLSVAINGGMRKPVVAAPAPAVEPKKVERRRSAFLPPPRPGVARPVAGR